MVTNIDDRIREFVETYVEPDKRGEALQILKDLKKDTIKAIMTKVNNGFEAIINEIDNHQEN